MTHIIIQQINRNHHAQRYPQRSWSFRFSSVTQPDGDYTQSRKHALKFHAMCAHSPTTRKSGGGSTQIAKASVVTATTRTAAALTAIVVDDEPHVLSTVGGANSTLVAAVPASVHEPN